MKIGGGNFFINMTIMEKGTVFTFEDNNTEIEAVVVDVQSMGDCQNMYICYAQNRLFTYWVQGYQDMETGEWNSEYIEGKTIVDYCIIPEYDDILATYHKYRHEVHD